MSPTEGRARSRPSMREVRARSFKGLALLAIAGTLAWGGVGHYAFVPAGSYPGADYTIPLAISGHAIVGDYVAQVEGRTIEGGYIETLARGKYPKAEFVSVRPFGSRTAFLQGINASGVAVGGYCPLGCGVPQDGQSAFIYDQGTATSFNFPKPGAIPVGTVANGINDNGHIVGGFCDKSLVCPQGIFSVSNHGFVDDHGTFTQLDYPGTVGATQAFAINNAGQIVGDYEINNSGPYGFLYANGKYQTINYPNAAYTVASAINNHGVIAGLYGDQNALVRGFVYQGGIFYQVTHPDTNSTNLAGINDLGVIVGSWNPQAGNPQNFLGLPIVSPPIH